MKKRHLSMPSFFLPQNACGRFTLVECDAMRAGTSHYPYTSATHDLFPAAKVRTIFESSTVFVCFFQSSPFPVSRIELAGLRLGAAPVLPATTLVYGCYYEMFKGCTSLNNITCLATAGINQNDGQVVDEAARIAVVYVFVTSRCDG